MFKVNDYIVCASNGVCKLIGIEVSSMGMANEEIQYYKLEPIYEKESVLYIPVNNDKIVMRKVVSKEEANGLIKDIPSLELLDFDSSRGYDQKYKEIIHKYDCREWLKVIKTSYLRKKERLAEGKKGTYVDDKYLKMAEDYLFGEFAIALDMPKQDVKNYIMKNLKK